MKSTEPKSKRGGARPGAGRKPGLPTRKTQQIRQAAYERGITPLEVMLGTMEALWAAAHVDGKFDPEKAALASAVAKDAAPYMHPRLSNIEANVQVSNHESALDELDGDEPA